jgi:hypothetical protein
MIHPAFAGITLALVAAAAGAQGIHKWIDAQGRVHFGDRPPDASGAYAPSAGSPAPGGVAPSEAERVQRRQKMLDAYQQERLERQEAEAKQKAEEAERQRRCAVARDRLARYERSGRIYEPLSDGGQRFLSDDERDAELRTARNEVVRYCGKTRR